MAHSIIPTLCVCVVCVALVYHGAGPAQHNQASPVHWRQGGQKPQRTVCASSKRLVTTPSMTERGDDESKGALHVSRPIENSGSYLQPGLPRGREQRRTTATLGGTDAASHGPPETNGTSRSKKPHEQLAAIATNRPQRPALVSALRPRASKSRTVGKSSACSSHNGRHKSFGDN